LLVAAKLLNEEPPFDTLGGRFSRNEFSDVTPILVVELFYHFVLLESVGKYTPLEQLGFIGFPLTIVSSFAEG